MLGFDQEKNFNEKTNLTQRYGKITPVRRRDPKLDSASFFPSTNKPKTPMKYLQDTLALHKPETKPKPRERAKG